MSTLQELILLSAEIESKLVANEGEVDEALSELLVRAEELPSKIDSIAYVLESLENRETQLKAKEQAFKDAARRTRLASDRMKSYLKYVMAESGMTSILGNSVEFKLSKTTPRLVIEDEQLLLTNDEYVITTIDKKLDNAKIKAELQNGKEIKGARLEDSYALRKGVK